MAIFCRNVKRQHDRSSVFMRRLVNDHPIRLDAVQQTMEESLGGLQKSGRKTKGKW